MNPARVAWATQYSLAQRLPITNPEPEDHPAPPDVSRATAGRPLTTSQEAAGVFPLTFAGQAISGRQWLVLQVPGGQIRFEGTAAEATTKARALAIEESAEFVVFRPVVILAPQTLIHEETISG